MTVLESAETRYHSSLVVHTGADSHLPTHLVLHWMAVALGSELLVLEVAEKGETYYLLLLRNRVLRYMHPIDLLKFRLSCQASFEEASDLAMDR